MSSGNSHRVKEVEVKEEFVIPSTPDEIKLAIEDKSNEEADAAAKVAEINKANPLGLIMFGGEVPDKPLALTMLEDKVTKIYFKDIVFLKHTQSPKNLNCTGQN